MTETIDPALPYLELQGTEEERQLAQRLHAVLRAMARFYPLHAPIRVPLSSVAEYFTATDPTVSVAEWTERLQRAIAVNDRIFTLETVEGHLVVVTTRAGHPPVLEEASIDTTHQLPRRFMEPPPGTVSPPPRRAASDVTAPGTPAAAEAAEAVPQPAAPVQASRIEKPSAEFIEDISRLTDEELADVVRRTLASLPEVIGFGDLWALSERVPRLSRGDIRRIRDYIAVERQEPVTDVELLEDVLRIRPDATDLLLYQLALDARLAAEDDFEFVGVPGAHAWILRDVSVVAPPKRRPADIGTDYRYLLEEDTGVQPASEAVVDHVLTFYEHSLGVLPYSAALAAVLPRKVYPGQSRALLRVEIPQTHETFWVELRYPSGNRGGFVFGFERFFASNLVPGALITIERSDRPGRYIVDYLPISRQERRLLALDEKQRKYVFRPTVYFCAVQDSLLLTEQRFHRFAGQEPLDERSRRSYARVLEITFERVGENVGTADSPRYMAALDDLFAGVNVERPLSMERIRHILTSGEYPQFEPDPDAADLYYYTPIRS